MLKKVPHTYVIVFGIIVFSAILTWFIPPGKYFSFNVISKTASEQGNEEMEVQSRMVFIYEKNFDKLSDIKYSFIKSGRDIFISEKNLSEFIDIQNHLTGIKSSDIELLDIERARIESKLKALEYDNIYFYKDDIYKEHKNKLSSNTQTWHVFSALFKGFVKQSYIIVFILIIGGAFWIVNHSRAIDVAILAFLRFTKKLEKISIMRAVGVNNIIITLIMIMFSLFGAIFGMSEETIAFAIILVPLAISMGYDSIVGVCLVYVAAHIGFAGAILNPFTIGIAQGLADIPLFSGIEYRLVTFIILTTVSIIFVIRYANKIKKKPELSPVYEEDEYWRKKGASEANNIEYYTPKMGWVIYVVTLIVMTVFAFIYPSTTLEIGNSQLTAALVPVFTALYAVIGYFSLKKSVHYFVLLLLAYTIIYLIIGVMGYGWYVMEIATLFLGLGIASGLAINKTANDIAKLFLEGVKDILSAAIIVGLAGGIIVVLSDGGIIDSILYGLSKAMGNFGKIASVGVMYVIQTIINVVIPSGSAKAAITMPIMAPFSDLIGISRQATVLAFQFGDGFTNMITPTSGILIAVLGVARIPYHKWVKWIWKFILLMIVLGFLLLIPTVTMELSGF